MRRIAKLILIMICTVALVSGAQSATDDPSSPEGTQARGYWVDPDTKLMWTGKDSGKDLSWYKAVKYCRNLRLAGYSDWHLPRMDELQSIYDRKADAPGFAGPHDDEPTIWHVKGNIFLTAYEWSSFRRLDDRGHYSGYADYFDFNEGKPNDDPIGWPYPHSFRRALCVRGPSSINQ